MKTTIKQWLTSNQERLTTAGIATARLDCLVLLEDALRKDRANILANQERTLTLPQQRQLSSAIERREKHEPLAYIRGKSEFYGRDFFVSKDTLEPRPESEAIIETLKKFAKNNTSLVDVGTGSGALAITSKHLFPKLIVQATEISAAALSVAKRNVESHHVNIELLLGNLLEPIDSAPDIIIANLPYVPDGHTINKAAMQEPALAIFGGPDGLELYRKLFEQLANRQWSPIIITESLPPQHKALAKLAKDHGFAEVMTEDFVQAFRPTTDLV